MKARYIRPDAELSDDTVHVVRGGTLDEAALRDGATAAFENYGTYAISVLALDDTTLEELAPAPPLVHFEQLTLMTVGAIRQQGLRLLPTGRRREHHSIEFDDLTDGIARLQACEHRIEANPYHER